MQMVWHLENRHVFGQTRKMTWPMHADGNAEMAGGRTWKFPRELYFHPKTWKLPKPAAGWLPIACSAAGPRARQSPRGGTTRGGQGTINGTVRDESAARQQVTLYLASPSTFPSEEGLALIRKGGLMEMEKLMAFGTKEGDQI